MLRLLLNKRFIPFVGRKRKQWILCQIAWIVGATNKRKLALESGSRTGDPLHTTRYYGLHRRQRTTIIKIQIAGVVTRVKESAAPTLGHYTPHTSARAADVFGFLSEDHIRQPLWVVR